ncbi:magnesium transporter CorA family protein [Plantactinospora mayteni]|uniref:Magnesium transporter CorA n=1 Tax=Plantactinospora mayteni TaxID=566021 RepID=A0ABQ4F1G3_9ACTN|nr:magnesium transporter CorA [Plantactinospora mayteni]
MREMAGRLSTDDRAVGWLDLHRPSEEDLHWLTRTFHLHSLAVEDMTHDARRAKLSRYDSHLLLSTYLVRLHNDGGFASAWLSAFVTPRLLITVHHDDFDLDELRLRWDEDRELAVHGVAFLFYVLLDMIIDNQYTSVRELDAALQRLEDDLFNEGSRVPLQRRIFHARRHMVRLREVALPMREVVNSVMRPTMHVVPQEMVPYYQTVYDHALRVVEWTDTQRDLLVSILDTNMMMQSNQLNVIVKQVTSWAAVIAVPTAVAGYFGQNVGFPWHHTTGFVISTVLTVGFAAALFVVFRRKGWL